MRFALALLLPLLGVVATAATVVTGADVVAGKHGKQVVTVVADIEDVLADDLNPDYHFLIL